MEPGTLEVIPKQVSSYSSSTLDCGRNKQLRGFSSMDNLLSSSPGDRESQVDLFHPFFSDKICLVMKIKNKILNFRKDAELLRRFQHLSYDETSEFECRSRRSFAGRLELLSPSKIVNHSIEKKKSPDHIILSKVSVKLSPTFFYNNIFPGSVLIKIISVNSVLTQSFICHSDSSKGEAKTEA